MTVFRYLFRAGVSSLGNTKREVSTLIDSSKFKHNYEADEKGLLPRMSQPNM